MIEIFVIIGVLAVALIAGGAVFFQNRTKSKTKVTFGTEPAGESLEATEEPATADEDTKPEAKRTVAERLGRARQGFANALGGVFGGSVSEATWESLEEALITADVGVSTSMSLIEEVKKQAAEAKVIDASELEAILKQTMLSRLETDGRSLAMAETDPSVWLFVGVNGVGKTTTIGKLGKRMQDAGNSVLMAAGDTFRAAAGEQLTMWAERCSAEVVTGAEGSDPSSVVFDGVEAAAARGCNLVLADTAGRLQNKSNLMAELTKIRRVAEKGAGSVSEVLLVIDATTGQNGLSQAKVFAEAVEVTGVVLTKLDGSAKGGIVFAIESELGLPVKLVGLGELAEDLVDFQPEEFVEALFA